MAQKNGRYWGGEVSFRVGGGGFNWYFEKENTQGALKHLVGSENQGNCGIWYEHPSLFSTGNSVNFYNIDFLNITITNVTMYVPKCNENQKIALLSILFHVMLGIVIDLK